MNLYDGWHSCPMGERGCMLATAATADTIPTTGANLPSGSTEQPRFGAFFVSVGDNTAEGANHATGGIYDNTAAYMMQIYFGRWEKGCIFATPKIYWQQPQRAVVELAICPLYGGGTGNGHTATNRAEDTQSKGLCLTPKSIGNGATRIKNRGRERRQDVRG